MFNKESNYWTISVCQYYLELYDYMWEKNLWDSYAKSYGEKNTTEWREGFITDLCEEYLDWGCKNDKDNGDMFHEDVIDDFMYSRYLTLRDVYTVKFDDESNWLYHGESKEEAEEVLSFFQSVITTKKVVLSKEPSAKEIKKINVLDSIRTH